MGQSLAHGSGWVALTYSRRARQFWNQLAADHSQAAVDAAPVLVLDMYEHAYHLDFGANATAYIDAFMRNIDWATVSTRMAAVQGEEPLPLEDPSDGSLPSLSVEELAAQLAKGEPRPGSRCAAAPPYVAHRGPDGRRASGAIPTASRRGSGS